MNFLRNKLAVLNNLLNACIKFIIILFLSNNATAMITVKVAELVIAQNQPLRLTIEIDTVFGTMPDLSNLEQDFIIVQRHANYSTRRVNTQTQQLTTFNLVLYPKRSGDLIIPSILIGNDESKPISIQVTPINQTDNLSNDKNFPAQSYTEQVTNENTINHPVANNVNIWLWLTVVTTLGWLITALAWWWQQRKLKFHHSIAITEPISLPTLPPYPLLEVLIADVKRAYRDIDPFAARNALLHWSTKKWLDDPPTNLSRLAARSNPQLQRAILMLEQALYSPESIPWHKEPVWEFMENS